MTPSSSDRWKNKFSGSLLVVVIAAMSTALYLSPTGQDIRADIRSAVPGLGQDADAPGPTGPAPTVTTPTPTPSPAPLDVRPVVDTAPPTAATPTPTPDRTPSPPAARPKPGGGGGGKGNGGGGNGPRIEGCWSFTHQQDAQAVYAADLSDPYGLDGPRGPSNGDGLACTQLPKDPLRATSIPVGAYVPPEATIATKAELVRPQTKYFGVAEDGIPGDTKLLDKLATQVGKAPAMIEWFSTFDEPYTVSKVRQSWARGALPVITWMPGHKGNKNPADTSLQRIADGEWDAYITEYAKAVAQEGKPVVIRFGHEQNGNWYPWSAGGNRAFERGDKDEPFFNTPALYRSAWQRAWQIFEDNGANTEAIWAWTPSRVDDIKENLTDKTKASYGLSDLKNSYPGDSYVDWTGLSAYTYKDTHWSYESTFAKSLKALKTIAPSKPILIAETGASENSGLQSNAFRKPQWIRNSLAGLAKDPSVVGFVWFNNVAVDVHTIDGIRITTDNKWDSSPAALTSFVDQIGESIWSTGTGPDTTTGPGS